MCKTVLHWLHVSANVLMTRKGCDPSEFIANTGLVYNQQNLFGKGA